MDIASAGFKAYLIEDVTMSFDNYEAWPAMKKQLKAESAEVVKMNGPEVGKVRALSAGSQGNQSKMIFHGDFKGPVFFGSGGQ